VLIDTAGRLHTKSNLMEELSKIERVIKKIDPLAPHSSIMVLDATTGTNAIQQLTTFKEYIKIDSLIITKLDGSAKGGIVVALAKRFATPILFIGVGEKEEDLNTFNASEFADSLVDL
jgi:fused signal recognition particle receptor